MSIDSDSRHIHSQGKENIPMGRRVVLVVGVDYAPESGLSRLQYAENDAQTIAVKLSQVECGFELHCPPLLADHATSQHVQKALLKLMRTLGQHDLLVFYFSGHGRPVRIEAERTDVYLVTSDYNEQDIALDENFYLSLRWLQDKVLRRTNVGQVLVLLDCCFPAIGEATPDPYFEELKQRIEYYLNIQNPDSPLSTAEARWSLTAASPTQEAREQDGRGHFTGALLRALDGNAVDDDGYVTVDTVSSYIHKQTAHVQIPGRYGFGYPRKPVWPAYHPRSPEQSLKQNIGANTKRISNVIWNFSGKHCPALINLVRSLKSLRTLIVSRPM